MISKNDDNLNYFSLPYPYVDFLVFNSSYIDDKMIMISKKIAKSLGFLFKEYFHEDGSFTGVVYATEGAGVDYFDNKFSLISGIAMSRENLLLSPNIYKYSDFNQINEDFGQFTAFLLDDNKITYNTDHFGAGHLYYYNERVTSYSIVSNRAHLLKVFLQNAGISLTLNTKVVKGGLFSNFSFFNQQSFLSEGIIKEIKLVRLGEKLVQKNGELFFYKNMEFIGALAGEGPGYDKSISDFCEKSISNLNSIVNSDCFQQHVLDLSGGKDSRLCLALLLNTAHDKEISVLANDVPNSDDLPIAASLVELLNLQYIKKWNSKFYPRSIDEGFNLWRSYFFGSYHRMGMSAWSPCGENIRDVRISGAGGEIYRAFWSNSGHFSRALLGQTSMEDILWDVINNTKIKNGYANEDLDELLVALMEEFNSLPGDQLVEKIDNHYLYHRNRTHFGLRGFSFYNECLTLTPLLSIDLLNASRIVTHGERQNYKIFYDLYHKLAPFLLNVRFDGDSSPFQGLDLSSATRSSFIKFNLNEDISSWLDAKQEFDLFKKVSMNTTARMQWGQYLPDLRKGALDLASSIENDYPDLLPKNIYEQIELKEKTSRDLSVIYSQLASIWDNYS